MRIIAVTTSIKKAVPIISPALLLSFLPLAMEHRGAPPVPKRSEKADSRVIRGKQTPTPVRAIVEAPGILPI